MHGLNLNATTTINEIKLSNETLNFRRREIYKNHFNDLERYLSNYKIKGNTEQWFVEQLEDWMRKLVSNANNHELEFTLFRKCLLREIDYFFIESFPEEFRAELRLKMAGILDQIQ